MSLPPPRTVYCCRARSEYPSPAPFHPDRRWPEYAFGPVGAEPNPVYAAVRHVLQLAGLDAARTGSPAWNPLGGLIRPGETVVLKPNLIKESHPRDPEGWRYVITHGSIIRAVADYVWKALEGRGRVIVADAPQTDSSFAEIVRVLGLDRIQEFYRSVGLDLELVDLRQEEWVARDGVVVERRRLPGDPAGCVAFDLADGSEFVGHGGAGRYYGADYDAAEVNRHHMGGRHEYLISGTVMRADVVFNLPKLKTHKKAGITVSLKNLVGINGDKNWLPHHTEADPSAGGDEHPSPALAHRIERLAAAHLRRLSLRMPLVGTWLHRRARAAGRRLFGDTDDVIRSGNWWGNETTWRMCLDLNKILLYGRAGRAAGACARTPSLRAGRRYLGRGGSRAVERRAMCLRSKAPMRNPSSAIFAMKRVSTPHSRARRRLSTSRRSASTGSTRCFGPSAGQSSSVASFSAQPQC